MNRRRSIDYFTIPPRRRLRPGPLRLDGKMYRKGLALQSRTVLSLQAARQVSLVQDRRWASTTVSRDGGNVHVEIKGDGKMLWQGDVIGSDPARELEVDVAGVKRLEIVVDYGADLDVGDRLDLCDARVTK